MKTGHNYLKLKTSIEVRWNSEHDCFERLIYHQECIETMDRRDQLDKISDKILTREEWKLLKASVNVLGSVKEAVKVFEN